MQIVIRGSSLSVWGSIRGSVWVACDWTVYLPYCNICFEMVYCGKGGFGMYISQGYIAAALIYLFVAVLSFVIYLRLGRNPKAEKLFIRIIDIESCCAMVSYIKVTIFGFIVFVFLPSWILLAIFIKFSK